MASAGDAEMLRRFVTESAKTRRSQMTGGVSFGFRPAPSAAAGSGARPALLSLQPVMRQRLTAVAAVPSGSAAASPRSTAQQQQRSTAAAAVPGQARTQPLFAQSKQQRRGAGGAGISAAAGEQQGPLERLVAADRSAAFVSDDDVIEAGDRLASMAPHERAHLRALIGAEVDERVAPLHTDFERTGWPAGCDPDACRRKLLVAYETCRLRPVGDGLLLRWPELGKRDLAARLGGDDFAAVQWLATSAAGDVRPHVTRPYDTRTFHSFRDESCLMLSTSPLKTHVAVGFVDLGTLSYFFFDKRYGPLRWIGVEASSYAVAKTAVLDSMLRAQASEDTILEVWYSAAWSADTLAAFRAAVDDLLLRGGADNEHGARARQPDVTALLEAWRSADVSLEQSRATWLKETTRTWAAIGTFSHEEDRNALCAYALTGQLLDGATVGSVCMFVTPPGFQAKRSLDESILECVPPLQLWGLRRKDAPNLVAAAAEYLRGGVKRLRDGVAAGQLTIELWSEHLPLDNRAALARVAEVQPKSMSWSNLCDYTNFEDFHAIARACSVAGTVHYGYSINWPQYVRSASMLDYLLRAEPPGGALEELRRNAIEMIGMGLDIYGGKPYVLWPPVSDLRNHVDWLLRFAATPPLDLRLRWADAFFAATQPEAQLASSDGRTYNTLSRSNGALYFSYTYDPMQRPAALDSSA
jgi:hypothetical protein